MICLITGGSGCGKSTWAEKLVASLPSARRIYIATMQVYDEESVRRVQRHRMMRADKGFETVECEKALSSAPVPEGSTVLLEDIVNLTANEMFSGGDVRRIPADIKRLAERCEHLIMVTNDVFSDGIRYAETTDDYLRKLASVNRYAAGIADHVIEVVYSIPVALKGEIPCV